MAVSVVAALRDALVANITAAVDSALKEVFSLEGAAPSPAAVKRSPGRPRGSAAKSRPRKEVTRWSPNRQARRVPKFVEEQTGFSLKNDISARYGDTAIFEKGKPAPKPLTGPGAASGTAEAKKAKAPKRSKKEKVSAAAAPPAT